MDFKKAEVQNKLLKRDLFEFSHRLKQLKIPHILLKGSAYRYRIYPNSMQRAGYDNDVLYEKEDFENVKRVLMNLGYCPSLFLEAGPFMHSNKQWVKRADTNDDDLGTFVRILRISNMAPKDILNENVDPPFFNKNGELNYYSVLDLSWTISLLFDRKEVFSSSIEDTIDDEPFRFLSFEWELVYSVAKLYFDSFYKYHKGLHQYADIMQMLIIRAGKINIETVLYLIRKYELQACFYYVFGHLKYTIGFPLSSDFLNLLVECQEIPEDSSPAKTHDQGDFLPFVLGDKRTFTRFTCD